jgi:hypothetical protein
MFEGEEYAYDFHIARECQGPKGTWLNAHTEYYFFYCFARVCTRLDFFVPFLSRKKGQEE